MVRSHPFPHLMAVQWSDPSVFHFGNLCLTRELIWSDLVMVCAACKLFYSTIDYVSI